MSSSKKKNVTEELTGYFDQPETTPSESQASEELDSGIQDLVGQLDEMKDKYLRALAEMENMKKRLNRDRENIIKYGNEGLLRDMLRVYDSINKSVQVAKELHPDDTNFIDGLEMVEKLFIETLKRHHVEPIDSKKGTPFNPNYHEAMMQRADDDINEPNIVIDEFEKGFMLYDRVLRPAKVSVSIDNTAATN